MNTDYQPIDWALYGLLIRNRRIKAGYKKGEDFISAVYRRTRVKISLDSMYKIERGKQIPPADVFMSINLVLYGEISPDEVMKICFTPELQEYIFNHEIPIQFKRENYNEAVKEIYGDDWKSIPSNINAHTISLQIGDKEEAFKDDIKETKEFIRRFEEQKSGEE